MSTNNKGKDDKQIEETRAETETAVSIDDGSTRGRMLLMNSNSPMQNATNTITQPQPQTETQQTHARKEATQRIVNEVTKNQTQQKKAETDNTTNTDADTRIDKVTGLSISVLNNLHKFLTHKTNAEKMKKKSQHQAHDAYNPQYHFNPHYQQQQQHLHRSLPYTGILSNASNNTPTPLQSVTQQTRAQNNKAGVSGGGGSESSLFGGRYHDSMISPLERKLGYTFREILEATNGENEYTIL